MTRRGREEHRDDDEVDVLLDEFVDDVPLRVDAPGNLLAEIPRHEVQRLVRLEVVELRPRLVTDFEDVAEPLVGDESEVGNLVLKDRVRADRRPATEEGEIVVRELRLLDYLVDTVEHASVGLRRRRGRLSDANLARVRVVDDDVGERAARVDPMR